MLEVAYDRVAEHVWLPSDFGVPRANLADLAAPAKEDNLRIAKAVLAGEAGPCRDIVSVNAAASLVAAGVAASLREGVELARTSIDSGAALQRLELLVTESNR